jgi:hypothetical protein
MDEARGNNQPCRFYVIVWCAGVGSQTLYAGDDIMRAAAAAVRARGQYTWVDCLGFIV